MTQRNVYEKLYKNFTIYAKKNKKLSANKISRLANIFAVEFTWIMYSTKIKNAKNIFTTMDNRKKELIWKKKIYRTIRY